MEEVQEGESSAVESPGGERKRKTERKGSSMQLFEAAGMGGLPLTRLNENNYQTWAVKAKMLLRKEDLWQIVSNPPPPR